MVDSISPAPEANAIDQSASLELKITEAREKCRALISELHEIEAEIPTAEHRVKTLYLRRGELRDGYNSWGQIQMARAEVARLEFDRFPIYDDKGRCGAERVCCVTDKFISAGSGPGVIRRYRRDNGWRERLRTPYDTIDAKKALGIWEAWKKGNP